MSCDTGLKWTPGEFAGTHDVYFGKTFADVNAASRDDPRGVQVSQGQTDAQYDPDGLLEYGQTYYWRIDEVNKTPDNTIFKGNVWSFTVEPYCLPAHGREGDGFEQSTQHGAGEDDRWLRPDRATCTAPRHPRCG